MAYGRIHYGEQWLNINDYILSGVQSFNFANTFDFQPINVLGRGNIGYELNNLPAPDISFEKIVVGDDPLFNIAKSGNIVSGVYKTKNNYLFFDDRTYINNFSLQCNVRELVKSSFNLKNYGNSYSGNFDIDEIPIEITGYVYNTIPVMTLTGSGVGIFTQKALALSSGFAIGTSQFTGFASGIISGFATGFVSFNNTGSGYFSGDYFNVGATGIAHFVQNKLYIDYLYYLSSLKPIKQQIPTFQSVQVRMDSFNFDRIVGFSYNFACEKEPIFQVCERYPVEFFNKRPNSEELVLSVEIDALRVKEITQSICKTGFQENIFIDVLTRCSSDQIMFIDFSGAYLTRQTYVGQVGGNVKMEFSYSKRSNNQDLFKYKFIDSYFITGYIPPTITNLVLSGNYLTGKVVCYQIEPYTGYLN